VDTEDEIYIRSLAGLFSAGYPYLEITKTVHVTLVTEHASYIHILTHIHQRVWRM
jgi:hypothetical protein